MNNTVALRLLFYTSAVCAVLCVAGGDAFAVATGTGTPAAGAAAATGPGTLDTVMNNFSSYTMAAAKSIKDEGAKLFWTLAVIELAFAGVRLSLTRAEFAEIVADLVTLVMTVGFFWWIFSNQTSFLPAIVNSFNKIGAQAVSSAGGTAIGGPGGVSPSTIMVAGAKVANKMWSASSFFGSGPNPVAAMIMCVFVVLMYGIVAGLLAETLIESYFVLAAGSIMLGFGGSRWTRDSALKMIWYAVSVGVKLLMMDLVIAVGMTLVNAYATSAPTSPDGFWGMAVTLIVLVIVTIKVPSMCQALVTGSPHADGSVARGMMKGAAMGVAAAGAVAAGVGGIAVARGVGGAAQGGRAMVSGAKAMAGAATTEQRTAAAKQIAAGFGQAMKGSLSATGSSLKSGAQSTAKDVAGYMTGKAEHRFGYSAARIVADVAGKGKPPPKPPAPSTPPPSDVDSYSGA